MKNSLVIGNTSQLSHYFPSEYDKISSRNINYELIKNNQYESIYLTFAEQRTFLKETEKFFNEINVNYTISVIDKIKNFCERIIIYSTSELWNNYEGKISLDLKYDYVYSPYIKSKEIISNIISGDRKKYDNVIIVYPTNFNSPLRKNGFLFGKIFDSLINKNKNVVGDLNFNRDIIHPSIIVTNSIKTKNDILVGSGELYNIENFIKDLFENYNLNYKDFIFSEKNVMFSNTRKSYFSDKKYSSYNELIKLTNDDIQKNFFS